MSFYTISKQELLDILTLDKKYFRNQPYLEQFLTKIFSIEDIVLQKELDEMEEQEHESIASLETENQELFVTVFGILQILSKTQNIVDKLIQNRSQNYELSSLEHDINNISKQINLYKDLLEKAEIVDNKNDIFKFKFVLELLKKFQKDKTQTLSEFHIILLGTYFEKNMDEATLKKRTLFEMKNKIDGKRTETYYNIVKNYDYFYEIYCLFNDYKLNDKKIYKSAGLRIYNLVLDNLNIKSKKYLADKVSHLFARLGIEVNIDYKRANKIKEISIYDDYIIYDYSSSTQNPNLYPLANLEKVTGEIISQTYEQMSITNYPFNAVRKNKFNMYLDGMQQCSKAYSKTKYIF